MDSPPALRSELVFEFVSVAHTDLERVKALLTQERALVNAAWDWGGGDWETGLGAAAMLGELEIVKAILTPFPEMRLANGPHGISLLAHAQEGGATNVVEFLNSL